MNGIVVILVFLAALGPLGLKMFLPALPIMQIEFVADYSILQLSISLGMISFALGTFLNGFLSDKIGRKPTILFGLLLFLAGNIICAATINITSFIIGRIVMTYGGSGVAVVVRAGISDIYGRKKSASAYAWLAITVVFIPMVAPTMGGYITELFDWRMIFVFMACCAVIAILTVVAKVPETYSPLKANASAFKEMKKVLHNRTWWIYSFLCGFTTSVAFTFLAGMPYIAHDAMKLSPSEYGNWLIVFSSGYIIGNLISSKAAKHKSVVFMSLVGCVILITGSVLNLMLFYLNIFTPIYSFGVMAFGNTGAGLIMPSSLAAAINLKNINKGASAAMQGLIHSIIPVIGVQYVGNTYTGSPVPTLWCLVLFSIIGLILALAGRTLCRSR